MDAVDVVSAGVPVALGCAYRQFCQFRIVGKAHERPLAFEFLNGGPFSRPTQLMKPASKDRALSGLRVTHRYLKLIARFRCGAFVAATGWRASSSNPRTGPADRLSPATG